MSDLKRKGKEVMSKDEEGQLDLAKRARVPVIETESEMENRLRQEAKARYKAIMLMMKKRSSEIAEDCYLFGELQEKRGMLMALEKIQSTPGLDLVEEIKKVEQEVMDAENIRTKHEVSEIDWFKLDCPWMI